MEIMTEKIREIALNVNAGRRLGGCAETLIHHRLYRPMQINVISYQ